MVRICAQQSISFEDRLCTISCYNGDSEEGTCETDGGAEQSTNTSSSSMAKVVSTNGQNSSSMEKYNFNPPHTGTNLPRRKDTELVPRSSSFS